MLGLVGFAFALGMRVDSGGTRGPSPDDAEAAPPNDRPQRFRAKQQVVSGAWRGFVFGFTANLLALRFVPEVIMRFTTLPAIAAWVALVLLSAAQALPWAVAGAIASWLSRPELRGATGSTKLVTPPFLTFAIGVYAATFVPAVFPWTPAGGLARWPVLLQTAELVGERGTSFLVSIGCGLVASAVARVLGTEGTKRERLRRGARPFGAAIAVFATLVTYGAFRMRSVDHLRDAAPHARVALLEPDFDAMFRWDERRAAMMMDRLSSLTKRAEASGAVLTVWPESAYPYTLAHGVTSAPRGARSVLQQGVRGPVLTGVYLSKGRGVGTNSAILVEPNGDIGPSYDKRHLLWFGETVPLADTFPVLARIFARGTGLAPGTESVAFRVGPITAAVLNCYEDTLPIAGREAMEARPNLLVNVTNDAWFSGSAEGELHLRLSVLRAIETRRDLVRAVNRGPTSWVGASGRVMARHDPTPGLGPSSPLLADAALLDAPVTLYTRAGDVPLLLVVALILASLSIHRRRWANHEATY
ncbi:MAG TPA: apolipoprotein N-acyltransferase [Labilithrix sp.]|nr:apolipoprotein N-acyltransferase [Labilithrix sp.]